MIDEKLETETIGRVASNDGLDGWLPIETAPRNIYVLVWSGLRPYVAMWVKDIFTNHEAWAIANLEGGEKVIIEALYWRPLPPPPLPSNDPVQPPARKEPE